MFGLGSTKSDRDFYRAFEEHAACSVEAARLLAEMLRSPARAEELSKLVHDQEHAGDKITHDTIARLHKVWITPIDRADIHSLITRLDDVLDWTEAVAERIALYHIDNVPTFAIELCDVLVRATEAVHSALRLLPSLKQPQALLDLCVEINRLENEGDRSFRQALAVLFSGQHDALHVLKWRDIIENMESATDRCEDVANILEGIVLEYA
jgi:predicted phosphate transport protein (TIGR00153 family)